MSLLGPIARLILGGATIEVPWQYARCILCLADASLTREHIIPEQIGGGLCVRFLCKPCNDRLGYEVEPAVRRDPAIRLALEHLAPRIPDLARQILQEQSYVGRGEGGVVRGRFKGGAFRVNSFRKEDGSVIQPIPDGREHLSKVLRKEGRTEKEVEAVLERFDAASENCLVSLGAGLAAVKWRIDELDPALDGPSLSEQALLKIAYEFLACHLGEKAYDESQQLAALRAAVLSPASTLDVFSIEYLTSRRYAPVHGLALAGRSPHVVVTICLFGWLRFRVHMLRIAIAPPYFRYTCLLDTGEELCELIEDRNRGEYDDA